MSGRPLTKPMHAAIEHAIAHDGRIPPGLNYNVIMGLWYRRLIDRRDYITDRAREAVRQAAVARDVAQD